MRLFVSIVSHGHSDIILDNPYLSEIASLQDVFVVLKDNCHEDSLQRFCKRAGIHYLTTHGIMGFGENNNFVFSHCEKSFGIKDDDLFLVINPDVVISVEMFQKLSEMVKSSYCQLFSVNLFKDSLFYVSEDSLRQLPGVFNIFNIFLKKPVCRAYDKESLSNFSYVDWASGAFLVFKAKLYKQLEGFDPQYFMYYEDVDICFRANRLYGQSVCFLKDVKAVHIGAYQNRKLFSKHFRWYISSLFKFLMRKTFFAK